MTGVRRHAFIKAFVTPRHEYIDDPGQSSEHHHFEKEAFKRVVSWPPMRIAHYPNLPNRLDRPGPPVYTTSLEPFAIPTMVPFPPQTAQRRGT